MKKEWQRLIDVCEKFDLDPRKVVQGLFVGIVQSDLVPDEQMDEVVRELEYVTD
jgi:hypothetical protein